MTKKSERYFKKIKIVTKNSQMEQKGDPDSDFSQNFFIFGNFVHACCFITHMMTATLAENRGTRIKGNKACDPGDAVTDRALTCRTMRKMPLQASPAARRKDSERIRL
ncbi:hypothetical protein WDV92_07240 [Pseudomonas syringae pv. atrofaciens]